VSPLQLGAMGTSDEWQEFGMAPMDKTNSFKLLDAYFDSGVSRCRPLHAFPVCAVPTLAPPSLIRQMLSEISLDLGGWRHDLITLN